MLSPKSITLFVVLGSLIVGPNARADVFGVDPTQTFLRTTDTLADDALIIDLSTLSFSAGPGNEILLRPIGTYLAPVERNIVLGVFSATDTLLDISIMNRVPGAIDAGNDFVSFPDGNGSTDIAEDFLIEDTPGFSITIPAGANYLFVGVTDNFYADNTDPENDFGIEILEIPSSAAFALFGMAGCGISRRRRL